MVALPIAGEGMMGTAQTGNPWIIAGACIFLGGYCLYDWLFAKTETEKGS